MLMSKIKSYTEQHIIIVTIVKDYPEMVLWKSIVLCTINDYVKR